MQLQYKNCLIKSVTQSVTKGANKVWSVAMWVYIIQF